MVTPAAAVLTPSPMPGGLLSVTHVLDGDWTRGVDVLIGSLTSPDRIGPCPVGSGETESPGTVARFNPVVIRQGVLCSTLGRPDVETFARNGLAATMAFALSEELYDGVATTNPALVDAVDLGDATTLQEAMSILEENANQSLSGRQSVIHVPVGLSSYLDTMVYMDNGAWRTKAGSLVAIHGAGTTVYATGEIWTDIKAVESQVYTDPRVNRSEGWADLLAIAVFDPIYIASVVVSSTTSPTSPTSV